MKGTTKRVTNQPKAIKNRITALFLALLLAATTLSPTITASATDIAENNSSGGTSAGAGDNLSIDESTGNDASFSSYIHVKGKDGAGQNTDVERTIQIYLNGEGHFNVRSVDLYYPSTNRHDYTVYIFSDEAFTLRGSFLQKYNNNTYSNDNYYSHDTKTLSSFGESEYYHYEIVLYSIINGETLSLSTPNLMTITSDSGMTVDVQKMIENTLDLSISDYKSDEDKANMTPVRDESIGYLPRARYFDDRNKHSGSGVVNRLDVTSTIQWDSFQEPYTDLDNPYYIEIYAKLHYTTGHKKESNPSIWEADTPSMKMYQYKKFGEIKYVSERFEFSFLEPLDNYLQKLDVTQDASGNTVNSKSDVNIFPSTCYVSDYYVRLVRYDYEKQQVLCGGFTKLTLDDNGGSTSSEGDFTDNDPDGDWKDDPDGEGDKDWDNEGDEKDPDSTDDSDNPDFDIDDSNVFTLIYTFIKALLNFFTSTFKLFLNTIKTFLIEAGVFSDLCRHVFSFLPDSIFNMIVLCFVSVVIMRFLGR